MQLTRAGGGGQEEFIDRRRGQVQGGNGSKNTHAIWRRVKTGTEREC
jgi:hypothetical protein